MMSQPYDESGYQLANEDMDDMPGQEGRSRDCKKSLFMKSSQDTPEDAASTQAQLSEAAKFSARAYCKPIGNP